MKRFESLISMLRRRRLLFERRLEDIRNFKLIKALIKLRIYKRRRNIRSLNGKKYSNNGSNDDDDNNKKKKKKENDSSFIYSHYSYAATVNNSYRTSLQRNPISNSNNNNDNNNTNSRLLFGTVSMKTSWIQLINFVKIRYSSRESNKKVLAEVSKKHMSKALSRLKLFVRYHKRRYVNRLIELSRLYIHMLYYDYKKRMNRKNIIIKREKAVHDDNNDYKTRLVVKYVEKWGHFITKKISNRLKSSGGHRYFR